MITAGGVTLGEIRSDTDGHLLVLSAEIDAGGFDGRCDGSVEATLTRDLGGGDNSVEPAAHSWVSIVPPDFAPGTYLRLPYAFALDYFVTLGTAVAPPDGVNVSFRRAVYPWAERPVARGFVGAGCSGPHERSAWRELWSGGLTAVMSTASSIGSGRANSLMASRLPCRWSRMNWTAVRWAIGHRRRHRRMQAGHRARSPTR